MPIMRHGKNLHENHDIIRFLIYVSFLGYDLTEWLMERHGIEDTGSFHTYFT